MVTNEAGIADVWAWLGDVADPEIPVISILDLGVVRDVAWADRHGEREVHVTITPTYSGCPAMKTIERDIVEALHGRGIANVRVDVVLAPAWTTDWLSARGRENLRAYGISPPRLRAAVPAGTLDLIGFVNEHAVCPRCGSAEVTLTSRFGSTPCKSLYTCTACREPFDHFKSH